MSAGVEQLRGKQVLVLNWRDVRHSQAGGAEWYMHQIARRWVVAGASVTWLTARDRGAARRECLDGIEVLRGGGELGVYARTAMRLLRSGRRFDAVVDCQNGIPFFSPVFLGGAVPTVQVVHHVHQDQFATRFSRPVAAVGRYLERFAVRHVYRHRPVAAVSASTRQELRQRLGFRGPVFIVPNGTLTAPPQTHSSRAAVPTVVVVSRLVAHKRIELLIRHSVTAAACVPGLRVEIVGDGPELPALRRLATELHAEHVTFHGRLADEVRDALLQRAWLTVSTSDAEGWGCTVIEAAARGVPCLARDAVGIRDSVVDGRTGWLVRPGEDFADALAARLHELADPTRAAQVAAACREWAGRFSWDRSASLLAGVVLHEIETTGRGRHKTARRRTARPDAYTVARFTAPPDWHPQVLLRATDEAYRNGEQVTVLLGGCDESDARSFLAAHGIQDPHLRLALHADLHAGPAGAPGFVLPVLSSSAASLFEAGEPR